MKNPLLDKKVKCFLYITAAAAIAVIYAFACGYATGLPYYTIWIDALVSGTVTASIITFLWNILRYGSPSSDHPYYKTLYITVIGIFFTAISIGSEALLYHTYFPDILVLFIPSIYSRILIVFLLYTIVTMYYSFTISKIESIEDDPINESIVQSSPQEEIIERLTIKTGTGIKVIHIEDIQFIKAEGDYVSIHTSEGQWLKEQTMKYMELHLPDHIFIRIHRSFIINTTALKRIERYGQQHLVELKNGDKIKISPAGYKALKEKLHL